MIKIGISGCGDSGKTTLCNNMKKFIESQGKDIYLVKEVARECPYLISENSTATAQRWIWEAHINEEHKAQQQSCDIILCDRTLMDNLLYYYYLLDNKPDPIFDALCYYTKDWMNTYDYISVLNINPEFIKQDINDPITIKDEKMINGINELFMKYLKPYQNIDINRFNYKEIIMEILNDNNTNLYI
jgi:thymidylate kinase